MIFDGRIPAPARERRPRAAVPLFAARREGLAVRDPQRLCRGSTGSRASSLQYRRRRSHAPPVVTASQLVDRRNSDPAAAEGIHPGAKHVNRWREAFLRDFAARLKRLGSDRGVRPLRWGSDHGVYPAV